MWHLGFYEQLLTNNGVQTCKLVSFRVMVYKNSNLWFQTPLVDSVSFNISAACEEKSFMIYFKGSVTSFSIFVIVLCKFDLGPFYCSNCRIQLLDLESLRSPSHGFNIQIFMATQQILWQLLIIYRQKDTNHRFILE